MNKIILVITLLCITGCTTSRTIRNESETSFVEEKDVEVLAPFEGAIMSSPLANKTYYIIKLDAWSLTIGGVTHDAPKDEHTKHTSSLLKNSFISSYFQEHSIKPKSNLILQISKYTPKIYLYLLLTELDKLEIDSTIYIAIENHKDQYLIHPKHSFPTLARKNLLTYSSIHVNQCSEIFSIEARNEVDTVKSCYESHDESLEDKGLVEFVVKQNDQTVLMESNLPNNTEKCLNKTISYLKQFQTNKCVFKISSSWIKANLSDMSFEQQYKLFFKTSRQVGIKNPNRLTWLSFEKTKFSIGDTKLEIDENENHIESILTEEEQVILQKNLDILATNSSNLEKDNALSQIYKIYRSHLTDETIQHITNSIDRDVIAGREFLAIGGYGKLPVGVIYSIVHDFYNRSQTSNEQEPYKDFSSSLFTYPIIAN